MVDKVKPLKFEDSTSGTGLNYLPTEADPSEDYLAGKGFAFENLNTHLAKKIGGLIRFQMPDGSMKPTFLGNSEIDYVEYFSGVVQTTINRRLKITMSYDMDLNPTKEVWEWFSISNGTTVLETITLTHVWSGVDLTKSEEVTS